LQMAYVEVAREAPKGATQPAAAKGEQKQAPTSKSVEQPSPTKPEPSAPITSSESETESKKKFTKSYGP